MNLKKLAAAAFVCGSIFACGCNDSYCEADATSDFKAAYLASPTDNRVLLSGINCFGPYFHTDIDGKGQILSDGTLSWEGKLDWIFTDKKTNQTRNENIPLYLEQRGGVMTAYAYRDGEWNKFTLPGIPSGLANAIKSSDAKTLQDNLGAVKSVESLNESSKNDKVRVTIDGKKAASLIEGYSKGVSGEQAVFINRLKTALNNTDITVDWDYNKSTKETVTINVNMTPLIRAYAKAIIDEMAAGKIKLTEEEKNYYAAIGYYAEMPLYISALGVHSNDRIMTPSNLNTAKVNKDVFADIVKEIATTPTK